MSLQVTVAVGAPKPPTQAHRAGRSLQRAHTAPPAALPEPKNPSGKNAKPARASRRTAEEDGGGIVIPDTVERGRNAEEARELSSRALEAKRKLMFDISESAALETAWTLVLGSLQTVSGPCTV
jgi:hypothetical protein